MVNPTKSNEESQPCQIKLDLKNELMMGADKRGRSDNERWVTRKEITSLFRGAASPLILAF
jgi:hypothetical protein